jgi:hypothetical protein
MTQADSVLSTPSTNTSAIDQPMFPPRDPTRRRFLAISAGANFVGQVASPPLQWRRTTSPRPSPCQSGPTRSKP